MIGRSSHIGNGLDFNGINQYGEGPNSSAFDNLSAFTLIAIERRPSYGDIESCVFSKYSNPSSFDGFLLGGNISAVWFQNGQNFVTSSNPFYELNKKNVLCEEWDSASGNFNQYNHGVLERTINIGQGSLVFNNNREIQLANWGLGLTSTQARYEGTLYKVVFYNKILTASQKDEVYKSSRPLFSPLVCIDFNQTSGNTAWDKSGNNNHCTLFNSPDWVDEKGNTAK